LGGHKEPDAVMVISLDKQIVVFGEGVPHDATMESQAAVSAVAWLRPLLVKA
jgi:hypothetical protein